MTTLSASAQPKEGTKDTKNTKKNLDLDEYAGPNNGMALSEASVLNTIWFLLRDLRDLRAFFFSSASLG